MSEYNFTKEGPDPLTPNQQKLMDKTHSIWHKAKNFIKRYFKWVIIILIGVSLANYVSETFIAPSSEFSDSSLFDDEITDEDCSVVGIEIHGSVLTYVPDHADGDSFFNYDVTSSENVIATIRSANEDENVKAILIEVDSAGGSPVGGEEIANALRNSEKPTVAMIREIGTSAAYLAASGTDYIFASKNSDVGSIGVTMSYLDNTGKNKKEGYTFEQLSAGKYKDYGNPDKPLTSEERALIQNDLDTIHKNFIAYVAENRNLPIVDVQKIATGASFLGEKAKALGLIDEIGGIFEVEKYLEEKIGEKPEICW